VLVVLLLRRKAAAPAPAAGVSPDLAYAAANVDDAATPVAAHHGGGMCGRCGGRCSVYQDPSAIATLASLLHHPAVVADFCRVDPDATKAELLRALAHRRYALGWYKASAGGDARYGVVPVLDDGDALAPSAIAQKAAEKPKGPTFRFTCRRRDVRIAVSDALLALVTAGILVVILVYYTNRSPNNQLEVFLNSQKFGPRFMMTVVGIFILGQWKRIERGEQPHTFLARSHFCFSPPQRALPFPNY
jgi:hypothetical protein